MNDNAISIVGNIFMGILLYLLLVAVQPFEHFLDFLFSCIHIINTPAAPNPETRF